MNAGSTEAPCRPGPFCDFPKNVKKAAEKGGVKKFVEESSLMTTLPMFQHRIDSV